MGSRGGFLRTTVAAVHAPIADYEISCHYERATDLRNLKRSNLPFVNGRAPHFLITGKNADRVIRENSLILIKKVPLLTSYL